VYTAFSGSHQDAIKKGMQARATAMRSVRCAACDARLGNIAALHLHHSACLRPCDSPCAAGGSATCHMTQHTHHACDPKTSDSMDALASRQVVKSTSAGVWEVRVLAPMLLCPAPCCPQRTVTATRHSTVPRPRTVEYCAEHGRLLCATSQYSLTHSLATLRPPRQSDTLNRWATVALSSIPQREDNRLRS
jgi:hypothetical protein